MLTVSGSFAYVLGASFTLLAGVAKAFSKKIAIKENSGLDDLNTCVTIIYDRFDGIAAGVLQSVKHREIVMAGRIVDGLRRAKAP